MWHAKAPVNIAQQISTNADDNDWETDPDFIVIFCFSYFFYSRFLDDIFF